MSPSDSVFWIHLLEIIGINLVLSGDNAIVIALAARGLPPAAQHRAVLIGSGAAVVLRVLLTIVAANLLQLPWLKLIGAALLSGIAVSLQRQGEHATPAGTSVADDVSPDERSRLLVAVRTILVADLVMSLDNVVAVAAAAHGSVVLVMIGLATSIPIVIFASKLLMNAMRHHPIIVTAGAGLIGWVAGALALEDQAVAPWIERLHSPAMDVLPAVVAFAVIALGQKRHGRV
jgi:YjbE family integral membrane protein